MSEINLLSTEDLRRALASDHDHDEDAIVEVTSEFSSEMIARALTRELTKSAEQKQPDQMKMLCMGAGAAKAEPKIAQLLGIPQENVTLVDKQYQRDPSLAQRNYQTDAREAPRVISQDLLAFIQQHEENPTSEKFDVLTFLGMEYILHNPDVIRTVLQKLSSLLTDKASVTIYPLSNDAYTPELKASLASLGFTAKTPGMFTFNRPQS